MPELLKREHNLAVLQISLDRAASTETGKVVFDLEIMRERIGTPLHIPCQQMGLPSTPLEYRQFRYEPDFSVPDYVVKELHERLASYMGEGVPLWIQLTNTSGLLPMVPWEKMLQTRLNLPILRLPYYTLKPFTDAGSLDVAICASSPEAKEPIPVVRLVKQITDELFASVNRPVIRAHVFADADSYAELQTVLKDYITTSGSRSVVLYDPKQAPEFEPNMPRAASIGARHAGDSPWPAWIVGSLAGCSIDALHFVGHGYLASDYAALAFAQSPTHNDDRKSVRFVSAQRLVDFSTQLGAWLMGFTSPPHNFSIPGMRLLVEQIARLRPGPVFMHEGMLTTTQGLLGQTYGFLCNRAVDTPPASGALMLYCHPWKIRQVAEETDLLQQYTLARDGKIAHALQADVNTPNWVAASQRYLENCTAEILNESQDRRGSSATRQGEEDALRFLSDVLTRHTVSKIDPS